MKILIDTSILVKIDRKDKETREFMKKLVKEHDVFISVITISEILTGSYLRKDYEVAVKKAKLLMGQMSWIYVDSLIAEKAGEINAYLITNGKKIEFPDVLISATSLILKCDYLITFNKKHFQRIPMLFDKVLEPQEFTAITEDEKKTLNS